MEHKSGGRRINETDSEFKGNEPWNLSWVRKEVRKKAGDSEGK